MLRDLGSGFLKGRVALTSSQQELEGVIVLVPAEGHEGFHKLVSLVAHVIVRVSIAIIPSIVTVIAVVTITITITIIIIADTTTIIVRIIVAMLFYLCSWEVVTQNRLRKYCSQTEEFPPSLDHLQTA